MKLFLGVLAGLVWGGLIGLVNILIMKKGLKKNDNNLVMAANLARMVLDLAALGLVFLLRNLLPFPYEPMLVGTAVALSIVSLVFAFRYGKRGYSTQCLVLSTEF